MTIQDAYNLTVTTSDFQGTPRTIGPQTFQGGLFNSYNIVLRQDQLAEVDLLISFRSRQFIQGTLDPRRLQVVTLNTLLADIKDSKIVYSLQLEDSFFILVVNIIEDLLLLAVSTYIDPLDVKTPVINIIKDLLLLAVSIYADPLDIYRLEIQQRTYYYWQQVPIETLQYQRRLPILKEEVIKILKLLSILQQSCMHSQYEHTYKTYIGCTLLFTGSQKHTTI